MVKKLDMPGWPPTKDDFLAWKQTDIDVALRFDVNPESVRRIRVRLNLPPFGKQGRPAAPKKPSDAYRQSHNQMYRSANSKKSRQPPNVNDDAAIAEYLARKGVTKCPEGVAFGAEPLTIQRNRLNLGGRAA